MPIAINAVISNIPSLGTTLLRGDKIGSVSWPSKTTSTLLRLVVNQDNMARKNTA